MRNKKGENPFVHLNRKNVFPGRRVTHLPDLPWVSQFFMHFLTKRGDPFTKERECWLGSRVIRLSGKLPTYPSPDLSQHDTYFSLRAKCWLRGGVGGHAVSQKRIRVHNVCLKITTIVTIIYNLRSIRKTYRRLQTS